MSSKRVRLALSDETLALWRRIAREPTARKFVMAAFMSLCRQAVRDPDRVLELGTMAFTRIARRRASYVFISMPAEASRCADEARRASGLDKSILFSIAVLQIAEKLGILPGPAPTRGPARDGDERNLIVASLGENGDHD